MIVNPQTFNYRLIIGVLIVAMISLGAYSLSSYNELKEQKEFLAQEKKIVENELSQIIKRYDQLMSENEDIKDELLLAKEKTLKMLDSFRLQEASVFIISKYRNQISYLNDERDELLELANSLKEENQQLHKVRKAVVRRLEKQTDVNNALSERNILLAENVKKGSVLTANSFSATAFRTKASGKEVETNKAKRTDVMEICFTLAENSLAEKGGKNLYIQVLNPNNNVLGEKISKDFGAYSLIYSTKTLIDYDNDVLDVCVRAEAGNDEKIFTKGTYFVNVFHDEKKLGSTKINLN
jgi:vacuolar-type H+-ATPase subunit I/STV1